MWGYHLTLGLFMEDQSNVANGGSVTLKMKWIVNWSNNGDGTTMT